MSFSRLSYLTAAINVGVEDTQDVLELWGDDQRLAKRTGRRQRQPITTTNTRHTKKMRANGTVKGKQLIIGWQGWKEVDHGRPGAFVDEVVRASFERRAAETAPQFSTNQWNHL